jgi:hypothetical protein
MSTPTNETNIEYLLAEMRAASLRARLWQADIDAVGIALKAGTITAEQALEELKHTRCLHLVGPFQEEPLRAEWEGKP